MSGEALSRRQRELLAASAAAGLGRATAAPDRPAEAGDVFVLAATAQHPVEWLLLERRSPSGPFLAVPADSHPFLGSRDLEAESSTGPLHLRCEAGVWVEPEALLPDRRSGTVGAEDLQRARQKLEETAREGFRPDPFLEEVDLSPEYEEWMREVIRPARAAAGPAANVQRFPPSTPAPIPFARPARRAAPPRLWAAAAAVFFLLSSGLVFWTLRQRQTLEGLEARSRALESELATERAGREGERRTAEAARGQALVGEGRARELSERVAALEKKLEAGDRPWLNPPVAILQPAEVMRGTALRSYRLPAEAPFLTVVLRIRESDVYPAYRLVVTGEGSGRVLWRTDELERSAEGIQVALPGRLVPPGRYRLSLSGLDSGKARPVADYELTVAR